MLTFCRRFLHDRKGGVAIALALAMVPLLGAAGAAIDYGRSIDMRTKMQKVADIAALKAAQGNEPFETRRRSALALLESEMHELVGLNYQPIIVPIMEDDREVAVGVTISTAVPTTLMRLVGITTVDVAVESRAENGRNERFDVAFVLDTTGSMAGSRLDTLKRVTADLIDDFAARRGEADQVRVSVIPFGQYVNVGLGNRTQPWLDVPADHRTPVTRTCRMVQEVVGRQCQRVLRPAQPARPRTCYDDGRAYQCGSAAQPARWVNQCTNIRGPNMVEQCSNRGGAWVRWNGCVGSRAHPDDTRDSNYGVRIPGLMNVGCGSPILEPTNNLPAAKSHIMSLTTNGETYIPAGLLWGWRAVSPHAPIAARGSEAGSRVRRYIVLVTDGQNTRSPTYPAHTGSDTARANAIMRTTCRNLAADTETDATLFTIAFEVSDTSVKEILEECSTLTGGAFYDAANGSALREAMQEIGGQIGVLRLTQ